MGDGIYRLNGGSIELKMSTVEDAIMTTDFYLNISKDGFNNLNTVVPGHVLYDTTIQINGNAIFKNAPLIYLTPSTKECPFQETYSLK